MYFLSLEAPGNFVPKKRLRVNVTNGYYIFISYWMHLGILCSFV